MEAELQHGHSQPEEAGSHSVAEGEGGGEKKSMFKKVKDKAKKIKDTINKKHGNGEDDEPEHEGYDEDDEDTEMVDEPEVHDAPTIRNTNLPKQVDMNSEKPTDPRGDRYDPKVRDEGISGPAKTAPEMGTQPHMPEMKDTKSHNTRLGKPDVEDPKIRPNEGSDEDPHALKARSEDVPLSNYPSKVNDPPGHGGGEAKVDPLIHKLQNLDVRGHESESNPKPEPTKDHSSTEADIPKRVNPDQSMPQDTVAGKVSSVTSAITGRAVSTKNEVASKLGYGGGQHQQEKVPESSCKKPITETATDYAYVIAEKLTPVYEKVAGVGTAVVSKVTGSGGREEPVGEKGSDKGVSVKEGGWAERLRPGDEDRALSGVITEALHKKKDAGEVIPGIGKVTESEEVRTRLGPGEENRRLKGTGSGPGPTAGVGKGGEDAVHGTNR